MSKQEAPVRLVAGIDLHQHPAVHLRQAMDTVAGLQGVDEVLIRLQHIHHAGILPDRGIYIFRTIFPGEDQLRAIFKHRCRKPRGADPAIASVSAGDAIADEHPVSANTIYHDGVVGGNGSLPIGAAAIILPGAAIDLVGFPLRKLSYISGQERHGKECLLLL